MNCQKCNSHRIVSVSAKCDDRCHLTYYGIRGNQSPGADYVPRDIGLGGGDYLKFNLCFACGQLQGTWPLPLAAIENLCQYCPWGEPMPGYSNCDGPVTGPNPASTTWQGKPICDDCWCELQND